MPTTLNTFLDSEFRMKFREPYVTEGLNQKMAVVMPPGVYRGFRLGTNGGNDIVSINPSSAGDSVATYQTDTRFSMTVTRVGSFNVDLSSLIDVVDVTVVIALYVTYVIGATSTATVRAYTIDPVDELTGASEESEVIILGTVVIPANGGVPIPAANITDSRRIMAWQNKAEEAVEWRPVLKNSSFEYGDTGVAAAQGIPFWVGSNTATSWSKVNFDASTGGFSVQPNVVAGPFTDSLSQRVGVEAYDGQRVLVEFQKKITFAASTGAASIRLTFKDDDGTDLTAVDVAFIADVVDGAFVPISEVVLAPTGAATLDRVEVMLDNMTYAGSGGGFLIDALQVYVEGFAEAGRGHVGEAVDAHQVVVRSDDPTALYTDEAAVLTYDHTTPATQGTLTLAGINTATDPILAVADLSVTGDVKNNLTLDTGDLILTAGELKHGDRVLSVGVAAGFGVDSTGLIFRGPLMTGADFGGRWERTAAGDIFVLPVSLLVGNRVKSIEVFYDRQGGTENFEFVSILNSTGNRTDHELDSDAVGAGLLSKVITVNPQVTIASGRHYWFQYIPGSSISKIYSIEITFDNP